MSGAKNLKEYIYRHSPHWVQNCFITAYNLRAYSYRYGGNYSVFLEEFRGNEHKSIETLKDIQFKRLINFLKLAKNNSDYYDRIIPEHFIENLTGVEGLRELPILTKEDIRKNIDDIVTISDTEGVEARTGGTTGASLRVLFTEEDVQRRAAHVDHHRSKWGYKLGERTAWFSGKNILTKRDVSKNRFWKTDHYHRVRYYSAFYVNDKNLKYYLRNLATFKPKYLIGYPSFIYELAKFGLRESIEFPNSVKAIFPNAETITTPMREKIEKYFSSKMFDQYGSSEGAPHIFENDDGSYYLNPEIGVIEVLDENNEPANIGRLVVTPFFTRGTPLIRYDIGDNVVLDENDEHGIRIKKIQGRVVDYIFSNKTGKINAANIGGCSKGVKGIKKFKVVQNELDSIKVFIETDKNEFTEHGKKTFEANFKKWLGEEIQINLQEVEKIESTKSGKFRVVENNIHHLIEQK